MAWNRDVIQINPHNGRRYVTDVFKPEPGQGGAQCSEVHWKRELAEGEKWPPDPLKPVAAAPPAARSQDPNVLATLSALNDTEQEILRSSLNLWARENR